MRGRVLRSSAERDDGAGWPESSGRQVVTAYSRSQAWRGESPATSLPSLRRPRTLWVRKFWKLQFRAQPKKQKIVGERVATHTPCPAHAPGACPRPVRTQCVLAPCVHAVPLLCVPALRPPAHRGPRCAPSGAHSADLVAGPQLPCGGRPPSTLSSASGSHPPSRRTSTSTPSLERGRPSSPRTRGATGLCLPRL